MISVPARFRVDMVFNETETIANFSAKIRSVPVHCGTYVATKINATWEAIFLWASLVVVSIASPISIILNVLIIIAVNQKKQLKKHSNFLLASMAVADFLVGAIYMPFHATIDVLTVNGVSLELEPVCILINVEFYFLICCVLCSIYHLTVIAWERYVAVRKWMDYKVIVTKVRVKNLAKAAWLLAIFTTVPAFILEAMGETEKSQDTWLLIAAFLAAFCFILMVYFYVLVYLGVRERNVCRISQVTSVINVKLQSKAAKMTGLVTAALVVSFVPGFILSTFGQLFSVLRSYYAWRVAEALTQLNSLLNPLLYCYANRRFRNAVLELLKIRKPRVVPQPSVRFIRRKDPFGSLEDAIDLQIQEQRSRLARSASFDAALVLDFINEKTCEIKLQRSKSAPSQVKGSNSFSRQKQRSSTITTTATIHAQSSGRLRTKNSYQKRRGAIVVELQTGKKRTRFTRSASTGPAVVSGCRYRSPREVTLKRSISAPSLGKRSRDPKIERNRSIKLQKSKSAPSQLKESNSYQSCQKQGSSTITTATIHAESMPSYHKHRGTIALELQAGNKKHTRFTRSASSGPVVGSLYRRTRETILKRSISAPSLGKRNSLLNQFQSYSSNLPH